MIEISLGFSKVVLEVHLVGVGKSKTTFNARKIVDPYSEKYGELTVIF